MKAKHWLTLAAVMWGCSSGEGDSLQVDFASELEIDPTSMTESSGLWYSDLVVGEGREATDGSEVVVHYSGWLADGTRFDSSIDRGQPFSFTLGEGEVIEGWEAGVLGMQVGGKRKLVLPPSLAYGRRGMPPAIPPSATLVFEIELIEIR